MKVGRRDSGSRREQLLKVERLCNVECNQFDHQFDPECVCLSAVFRWISSYSLNRFLSTEDAHSR